MQALYLCYGEMILHLFSYTFQEKQYTIQALYLCYGYTLMLHICYGTTQYTKKDLYLCYGNKILLLIPYVTYIEEDLYS